MKPSWLTVEYARTRFEVSLRECDQGGNGAVITPVPVTSN
jgi:hypothetical protein